MRMTLALSSTSVLDDQRHGRRTPIGRSSTLRTPEDAVFDVEVADLSSTGMRFSSPHLFAIGSKVRVGLSGGGTVTGQIIRRDDHDYGCRFFGRLSDDQLSSAFAGDTVIPANIGAHHPPTEEVIERWPRAVRGLMLLSFSFVLWAGISFAITGMFQ